MEKNFKDVEELKADGNFAFFYKYDDLNKGDPLTCNTRVSQIHRAKQ